MPAERELDTDPEAVQRAVVGSQQLQRREQVADAAELVVVLARLQRDVVAEPLRLLVRVGVTADVDEQRRVVDVGTRLLVEPDALGQPQRDPALSQHVLHRLAEAEIDPQRQRADELSQANAHACGA